MDVNEFLERARLIAMRARAQPTAADLASVAPETIGGAAVNLLCELLPRALCEPLDRDTRRKRAFSDDGRARVIQLGNPVELGRIE